MDDQFKRQNMKMVHKLSYGKSPKVVSFSEPLASDIRVPSPIVAGISIPSRQKRTPSPIQKTTPRTRSQTKFEALKQQEIPREEMAAQGQEKGGCPSPTSNPNGKVQFIEAPKVN